MKPLPSFFFLPLFATAGWLICAGAPLAVRAQEIRTQEAANARTGDLSGSFTGFALKRLPSGMLRISGTLTFDNNGLVAARNVHANFYLSTDSSVDPEDLVHTLQLSDYNGGIGKLEAGSRIEVPLHEKIVSFVGSLLEGQYLLVEFVAGNSAPGSSHKVVVIGPIIVPK